MNADIAFNEVEARVAQETTDRVRPDIQTIDFIVVVGEQTLGQVVTDKTVHAKDQHAGTAFNRHNRLAAQYRTGYQPQRLRQLRTLHVNAALGLTGYDLQRAILASDHQRRGRHHRSRLRRGQVLAHAGFPDDKFIRTNIAKRARPRIGNGADQVMQR
ncbi:Uncharacterised protein [Raoultella ornithinolytica]|nr:Uncharacterised protein [Raoultella ornithinolytica]